jgi:hypothetical protein
MVTVPPWPVSTDFGTCLYQCFLSNCTPVSLHMLKCSCAHNLSCLIIIIIIVIKFYNNNHYFYCNFCYVQKHNILNVAPF